MSPRVIIVASVFAILAAFTSSAAPLQNPTGLVSPSAFVTFDEVSVAQGAAVTDQFLPFGVSFSPNLYFGWFGSGCFDVFPGLSGNCLSNFPDQIVGFEDPQPVQQFSLKFAAPQSAAAFALVAEGSTTTLTALLAGSLVESFSVDQASGGYFGFSGTVFDEIQVSTGPNGALIDNIQLQDPASVPEPGTIALSLTGLGVCAALRRHALMRAFSTVRRSR